MGKDSGRKSFIQTPIKYDRQMMITLHVSSKFDDNQLKMKGGVMVTKSDQTYKGSL